MNKECSLCVFVILLIVGILLGCRNNPVEMPKGLYGRWKSKQCRPDIVLNSDSLGYFAIVYHHIYDGRICPVRYPLYFTSEDRGIIQAEGRINLYYDRLKNSLYLSPGGDYNQ